MKSAVFWTIRTRVMRKGFRGLAREQSRGQAALQAMESDWGRPLVSGELALRA